MKTVTAIRRRLARLLVLLVLTGVVAPALTPSDAEAGRRWKHRHGRVYHRYYRTYYTERWRPYRVYYRPAAYPVRYIEDPYCEPYVVYHRPYYRTHRPRVAVSVTFSNAPYYYADPYCEY